MSCRLSAGREDCRALKDRPPGRDVLPAPAGPGAPDARDRARAGGGDPAARRRGGDAGPTPVHDDAGGREAGIADGHERRAGRLPRARPHSRGVHVALAHRWPRVKSSCSPAPAAASAAPRRSRWPEGGIGWRWRRAERPDWRGWVRRRATGGEVLPVPTDVSDEAAVRNLVAR